MGINITPPSDDAKLHALTRPASARQVEKPVSELEETERSTPVSEQREHDTRDKGERRLQQRRRQGGEAYLDTREHHERRNTKRRAEDREQASEKKDTSSSEGIDVMV
ncbi:hypothetical protein [Solemya velesiana gill symbiont]|uniref:Uncharacterized protein n=1 Tax=Solemya velesiana gill symbiont TaxID=1918948 RepID=A0A1T2KSZ6_9GAMM|nr:hypothetical protein [Solemya velesiana gill symbiont]OOZ35975.1 hypothetical protein BOW51_09405 [Solemya velesiana gill symbiont]